MTKFKISIALAIQEALSGFKNWWLWLCALSLIIMLSQSWLPRLLYRYVHQAQILNPYIKAFTEFKDNIFSIENAGSAFINLRNTLLTLLHSNGNNWDLHLLVIKAVIGFIIILMVLCLLYIITIIISKISVYRKKSAGQIKHAISRSHLMSISYFSLAVIKIIPFTLSLLIPVFYFALNMYLSKNSYNYSPVISYFYIIETIFIILITLLGVVASTYIYIKLYFTGFIITEKTTNPIHAIIVSWKMTDTHFRELFIIFAITLLIDLISAVTIIGFIPGTGIKYTLRASAYKQLKNDYTQGD